MKVLKTLEGKKTVLRSFETENQYLDKRFELVWHTKGVTEIWHGTKEELLEMPDEFFEAIAKRSHIQGYWYYYQDAEFDCLTPKESIESAIDNNFVLITEETI